MLDAPKYRAPGERIWATKPMGDRGDDVHPWGWREQFGIPAAIIVGIICCLGALVAAIRRGLGWPTIVAAAGSTMLLLPVTVWPLT